MTDTAAEVPVMGLGIEQRQLWMQAATTLASSVFQRRMAEGRPAWSEGRAAEREHERTTRLADPMARSMSAEERDAAAASRRRSEGQQRRVDSTDGWVNVWVGPLPGGRFGLLAEAGVDPDEPPTAVAAVSCTDPTTVVELAEDLLDAHNPKKVTRLHDFATRAADRAADAARDILEPEDARIERAKAAVREVWTGEFAPLAERTADSPAIGALAWRLAELEERGYAFGDVLGKLDAARLMRHARDPAAMAAYFIAQNSADWRVINLDPERPASTQARTRQTRAPQATPTATTERPGPATEGAGRDPGQATKGDGTTERQTARRAAAQAARAREATVGPILAEVFAPDVVDRLTRPNPRSGRSSYPPLRDHLYRLTEQGLPVAAILRSIPASKLMSAHVENPAAYLLTAVKRHPGTAPPQRTGPDRAAMADLAGEALAPHLAAKIIDRPGWPALARRMATMCDEGLPVRDMLAHLPATRLEQARTPAALASRLLDLDAARRRAAADAGQTPSADRSRSQSRPPAAAPRSNARAQQATEPASPSDSTGPDRDAVAEPPKTRDADHTKAQQATPHAAPPPTPPPVPEVPRPPVWTSPGVVDGEVLYSGPFDPASAVDRVGMEASIGLGSLADTEDLEARLAAPRAASAAARAGAELVPLSTAVDRDDVAVGSNETGGRAGPRRDAEARAAAADARRDPAAAATRAEVTYTPDAEPTASTSRARRPRNPPRPVPPPPSPKLHRTAPHR